MVERTIQFQEKDAKFIESYKEYGFSSVSELITTAIELLEKELENQKALIASAELYAQVYDNDEELQEWTDSVIEDWE